MVPPLKLPQVRFDSEERGDEILHMRRQMDHQLGTLFRRERGWVKPRRIETAGEGGVSLT